MRRACSSVPVLQIVTNNPCHGFEAFDGREWLCLQVPSVRFPTSAILLRDGDQLSCICSHSVQKRLNRHSRVETIPKSMYKRLAAVARAAKDISCDL